MIWFKPTTKQVSLSAFCISPIIAINLILYLSSYFMSFLLYICKESSTVSNQRKFPGTIASWPIGRSDAENESRPHSEFGGRLQSIPVVCSFLLPSHCSHTLLCPSTLPLTLIIHQDVRASGFQVRSAFQAGKEPLFLALFFGCPIRLFLKQCRMRTSGTVLNITTGLAQVLYGGPQGQVSDSHLRHGRSRGRWYWVLPLQHRCCHGRGPPSEGFRRW